MNSKRISMRDIATEAGVSVMTVSLALRNSPRLSAETRENVQAIAKKLGFMPDPALQALATYRTGKQKKNFTGVIAYINNSTKPSVVRGKTHHQKIFAGATAGATTLGYKVEEFWLRAPELSPQRAADVLRARGIQGLILGPQEKSNTVIEGFDWSEFSVVTYGFSLRAPRFNVVATETFKAMLICMKKLQAAGYRRPGLIIFDDQDTRTQNRYSGAYCASWEMISKSRKLPKIFRDFDLNPVKLKQWIERYKFDAIIGARHRIQLQLEKLGYRIPDDIGFACPFGIHRNYPIAHADGRPEEVGRIAVELVCSMINQNEKGIPVSPRTITIDPDWVPGPTIRNQ
ncbi:MAG: LacI family DNA-binding transcriptional regulator [Kiritimatiellales bacterium]